MRYGISNGIRSALEWLPQGKMLGFATALAIATIGGREIVGEPAVLYTAPVVAMVISLLPATARRLRRVAAAAMGASGSAQPNGTR